MSPTTSYLLQKPLSAPVAWLSSSSSHDQIILGQQFLLHVQQVAKTLPADAGYAINLCDNRYLFLVSLCAVILCKQTNLLPPNKNSTTQQDLYQRYEKAYLLHDGQVELAPNLKQISLVDIDVSEQGAGENVEVELDHIALISFTSGSTGASKANIKTWRTLQQSSLINSHHMLPNSEDTFYHLATVPGQHMWGLETSVIMALFANACLVDAKPLFPHDIMHLLNRMPEPRCLVSTPFHLRALSVSACERESLPNLANILTATAPIEQELAKKIEQQFSTDVTEVYGCSEVGSMAFRQPAKSDIWTQFKGLNFTQKSKQVIVNADYLPGPVLLDDELEFLTDQRFKLKGRRSDQIKIAGKRGSLYEVNRVLNTFEGVQDGIVFFPEQTRLVPRLVALVVLSDAKQKKELQAHFRRHLDAAFVPRPIFVVDELPRQENGKLNKSALTDFYQQLVSVKQ